MWKRGKKHAKAEGHPPMEVVRKRVERRVKLADKKTGPANRREYVTEKKGPTKRNVKNSSKHRNTRVGGEK